MSILAQVNVPKEVAHIAQPAILAVCSGFRLKSGQVLSSVLFLCPA